MKFETPQSLLTAILTLHKADTVITTVKDGEVMNHIYKTVDKQRVWAEGSEVSLLECLGEAAAAVVRVYTGEKRDGGAAVDIHGYVITQDSKGFWEADKMASFDLELSCTMDPATGMRSMPKIGERYL